MGENQERRQAHRQKRGLLRVEEILSAAGTLFAEVGYDKATTNMIAARAGISPGRCISFFRIKKRLRRHLQQMQPNTCTKCITPCFRPR